MPGSKQLEHSHHQRASQTYDSGGDHLRTGQSHSVHLQIHLTHEASLLTTFNSHRGRLCFLLDAIWSQDESRHVSDTDGCHSPEQCPGVIGIHDNMVIFGVDQEDHDSQPDQPLKHMPEGRSCTKQQETGTSKRERVTFFGAEYSAEGHASRPQEGWGDHRNDTTSRQATTSVFSLAWWTTWGHSYQTYHITQSCSEQCLKRTTCFIGKNNKLSPFRRLNLS